MPSWSHRTRAMASAEEQIGDEGASRPVGRGVGGRLRQVERDTVAREGNGTKVKRALPLVARSAAAEGYSRANNGAGGSVPV